MILIWRKFSEHINRCVSKRWECMSSNLEKCNSYKILFYLHALSLFGNVAVRGEHWSQIHSEGLSLDSLYAIGNFPKNSCTPVQIPGTAWWACESDGHQCSSAVEKLEQCPGKSMSAVVWQISVWLEFKPVLWWQQHCLCLKMLSPHPCPALPSQSYNCTENASGALPNTRTEKWHSSRGLLQTTRVRD